MGACKLGCGSLAALGVYSTAFAASAGIAERIYGQNRRALSSASGQKQMSAIRIRSLFILRLSVDKRMEFRAAVASQGPRAPGPTSGPGMAWDQIVRITEMHQV